MERKSVNSLVLGVGEITHLFFRNKIFLRVIIIEL